MTEHLPECDEAVVPSDHAIDVAAEHRPAREKRAQAAEDTRRRSDRPAEGKPVYEARDGGGGGIANDGGEGRHEDEEEDEEPAAGPGAPRLGVGRQPGEEAMRVDEDEDDDDPAEDAGERGERAVERRQTHVRGHDLLAP